ncbi:GDSL esterase/lipase At5g14450 [Ricinus communis]|uniref:Alpha-L-fucosidase 2, putative n=1 Tax=Ricinus communis TaxID=3988 RepID=B9SVM5_RICCO|nr:GDSL esterase/lipase At5g14450 [Ricinus communis]EEF32344.1 Alpha-L-fucosidase 2 precursor, putative [Ricinus communis]|eukprot:XP_002530044.1 GDSL esterase/lipase At5g14450 [Ricinus communis]
MNWSRRISRKWKLTLQAVAILLSLALVFSFFPAKGGKKILGHFGGCNFPAIFNFGDSNSDTGGKSAAFHRLPYPNGYSLFKKPSGRYCDGRDIIDFIAERLGLPYLNAYLDSIGTNFRHGANFATGGSTIQPVDSRIFEGGFSPISLDIQLLQFEQFKERTLELYNQGRSSYVVNSLPRPEDFSKALYTLDIGQNDLHSGFGSMTEKQVLESIPGIINHFAQAVEKLYQLGARTFWIHNTGPIGCLPYAVIKYPPEPGNMDQIGCVNSHNNISQDFNRQLKDRVSRLRKQLPDAALTYTDIYTAKYSLISESKNQGFADPFGYCCGHYGDYRVQCGGKATVNGTEISGDPCSNPELYISWDGIHYSQAANQIVANRILDGFLSDPPLFINETCGNHT